jgi:hypothetical protein
MSIRNCLRLSNETGLVCSVPDLRHPARPGPVGIGVSVADQVECGEVLLVGIREGVEVLLRGRALGVAHPVHDGLEIGSACQQPGWVGIAQVVDADVKVDPGRGDCRSPQPTAEGVTRDRVQSRVAKRRSPDLRRRSAMWASSCVTSPGGMPMVRGSLSLGSAW